jgi:hypothetical protein
MWRRTRRLPRRREKGVWSEEGEEVKEGEVVTRRRKVTDLKDK